MVNREMVMMVKKQTKIILKLLKPARFNDLVVRSEIICKECCIDSTRTMYAVHRLFGGRDYQNAEQWLIDFSPGFLCCGQLFEMKS